MDEEKKQRVEAFAHEILYSYYTESDVELLIAHLAPEVVWLGAGRNPARRGARGRGRGLSRPAGKSCSAAR